MYIQSHSNPVLVPNSKPTDPVMNNDDNNTDVLKVRVDIWTRMDVVPLENGISGQMYHLKMWFFKFINGKKFKGKDLLCWIFLCWCGFLSATN